MQVSDLIPAFCQSRCDEPEALLLAFELDRTLLLD
jgi:hypothetical protein